MKKKLKEFQIEFWKSYNRKEWAIKCQRFSEIIKSVLIPIKVDDSIKGFILKAKWVEEIVRCLRNYNFEKYVKHIKDSDGDIVREYEKSQNENKENNTRKKQVSVLLYEDLAKLEYKLPEDWNKTPHATLKDEMYVFAKEKNSGNSITTLLDQVSDIRFNAVLNKLGGVY